MTAKTTAVLLVVVFMCSCAGPSASREAAARAGREALIADIEVPAHLDKLTGDQARRLEAATARVLVAGPAMIEPLLDEISTSGDQYRRLILIKILFYVIDDLSPGSVETREYYAGVERTGKRLLASDDAPDRYMGALLTALPQRSLIVPTAVTMLSDADVDNRRFAIDTLRQVAGRDLGYAAEAPDAERAAAAKRWRQWWRNNSKREVYYQPSANPILSGLRAESLRIMSSAGPYGVQVLDEKGNGVADAVVAYSYRFSTPDGVGKVVKRRGATDDNGKTLLAGTKMAGGLRYLGAQVIVSKIAYPKHAFEIGPHFLTPNSFSLSVTLTPQ